MFSMCTTRITALLIVIISSVISMSCLAQSLSAALTEESSSKLAEERSLDVMESKIQRILEERVDKHHKSIGISVGIINAQGSRIVCRGRLNHNSQQSIDEETIFELCSVTKVFTGLLLAQMAECGEIGLDDFIEDFLPEYVKVPSRHGQKITFRHLATHTSGLPRMPDNLSQNYTVELMYEFLSNYTLTREIGAEFEYSNLGFGLLGHLLSRKAGVPYEKLIIVRICKPLEMNHTRIRLSQKLKKQLVTGHNYDGQAVERWALPETLIGAGALRSTTKDLLKFLAANMGLEESSLFQAMLKTQPGVDSGHISNSRTGLGWNIRIREDSQIIWHMGEVEGHSSFIGFDRKKCVGVVVLSNSGNSAGDIGFHLLDDKYPLTDPQKRVTIRLEPEILNKYVGKYKVQDGYFITISREGDRLFSQSTGMPKLEIFPESETKFFLKKIEVQITFVKDENGNVMELIVHQGKVEVPAKKIEDDGEQ